MTGRIETISDNSQEAVGQGISLDLRVCEGLDDGEDGDHSYYKH